MAFKQAERKDLYLRCALFGPSGSGKTMTALRMAKGICEKIGGKFAVIDTESRSASKYADRISFDVDDLSDKSIESYLQAMDECVKAGYKVLVIDSLSHAWRELTEEVDRIAQSGYNKNTFSAWGKVSPKQKRLIEAILNFPGHIIATMRSKTEWVIGENKNGKMAPEKLGLAPEQGKGIEYEFDLLVELNQNHVATVTKDRTGKFQDSTINKPGEDFGKDLVEWLIQDNPVKEKTVPVIENQEEPQKIDLSLKEQGNNYLMQIGDIVKFQHEGKNLFTEEEKTSARNLVKSIRFDEHGISELKALVNILEKEKETKIKNLAA